MAGTSPRQGDVFDEERFRQDVRAFRKRRGWTIRELADASGVMGVRDVINGRHALTLFTTCSLATVADLDLDLYRKDTIEDVLSPFLASSTRRRIG